MIAERLCTYINVYWSDFKIGKVTLHNGHELITNANMPYLKIPVENSCPKVIAIVTISND